MFPTLESPWSVSKKAIIGVGGLTLTFWLLLLLLSLPRSSSSPTRIASISADQVKQSFNESYKLLQEGDYEKALIQNDFLIVDIRPITDFNRQHLEGAISVPATQLQYASFESDAKLIIYSDSTESLEQSISVLQKSGVKDVYLLDETLSSLELKGYKVAR